MFTHRYVTELALASLTVRTLTWAYARCGRRGWQGRRMEAYLCRTDERRGRVTTVDLFLQKLFQDQVWTQCQFATFAYDDLVERLPQANGEKGPSDEYRALVELPRDKLIAQSTEVALERALAIWSPIQAFLTATANVSKILWGSDPAVAQARAPLRDALKVSDASPLRSQMMRNNFDHFDARIDIWWGKSSTHNFVDMNFGDTATVIEGLPEDEMFRNMDLQTGDVIFWGQRYNLPSLNTEIRRIMPVALREATKELHPPDTSGMDQTQP